jgi:hypothetical protein
MPTNHPACRSVQFRDDVATADRGRSHRTDDNDFSSSNGCHGSGAAYLAVAGAARRREWRWLLQGREQDDSTLWRLHPRCACSRCDSGCDRIVGDNAKQGNVTPRLGRCHVGSHQPDDLRCCRAFDEPVLRPVNLGLRYVVRPWIAVRLSRFLRCVRRHRSSYAGSHRASPTPPTQRIAASLVGWTVTPASGIRGGRPCHLGHVDRSA